MKKVLIVLGVLLSIGLFLACNSDDEREIQGCFLVEYQGCDDYSWVVVLESPEGANPYYELKPFLRCSNSDLRKEDGSMPSVGDIISLRIIHAEEPDNPFVLGPWLICDVEYCK